MKSEDTSFAKLIELNTELRDLYAKKARISTKICNIEYEIACIENSRTCDICGATFLCPSNNGKVFGASFEELGPVNYNGKIVTFVCAKCLAKVFAKNEAK